MPFLILIFLFLSLGSQSAVAQSGGREVPFDQRSTAFYNYFDIERYDTADPEYLDMTRQLIRQGNLGFNFAQYRLRYMQSSWYDPIGEKIVPQLLILSEKVKNGDVQALKDYNELVAQHLAHIDVVMFARDEAREDSRLGSEVFYDRVSKGIIRSVLVSGDGSSPNNAYDIITLGEETMLLAQLGLRPLESRYMQSGLREVNYHIAEEVDTGKMKEVFVDVRYPMSKIRYDRKKALERRNPLARP